MTFPFTARRSSLQNVTIFTDASYFDGDQSAGGAFWAKGGSGDVVEPLKKSGSFGIKDASCSGTAEAIAALRSMAFLFEDPDWHAILSDNARLILVVDCKGVQDMLEKGTGSYLRNHVVNTLHQEFLAAKQALGFQFKCNWVKAHQGGGERRSWVNEWCDKHAKKARQGVHKERIQDGLREAWTNPEAYNKDEGCEMARGLTKWGWE